MKRVLFVGFCVLLSCSVLLIGVDAADTINFVVTSASLVRYTLNGSDWISSSGSVPKPLTGDRFCFNWRVDGYWDVLGGFDTSPYLYFTCEIVGGIYSAGCEFDPSGYCEFGFGDGETVYSDAYLYGVSDSGYVTITWLIDIEPDATSKLDPPFNFYIPFVITKDGNWNGYSDWLEFSASASIPDVNYEDMVITGMGDISDKLSQILVDIDSEELASLIEEKLRESELGDVPSPDLHEDEFNSLGSLENDLYSYSDGKLSSGLSDSISSFSSSLTSVLPSVGGSYDLFFNRVIALPFVRDLVYISLGFGLMAFVLRLGRKVR